MNDRRKRLLIGSLLITLGVVDIAFEPLYRLVIGKASYATEAAVHISGSELELVLERQAIHLFLAEYERTLILRGEDRDILRLAVADDTGGHSGMELYRISESEFYLHGYLDSDRYYLDVEAPSIRRSMAKAKPAQARYLGRFDHSGTGWRYIPAASNAL